MNAYAVWESEYPEEGSTLVIAASEKGARRWYRKATRERACGVTELVPLSVERLTATQALVLARSET